MGRSSVVQGGYQFLALIVTLVISIVGGALTGLVYLLPFHKYRKLGEYLLISSLPGKALRTLVDIAMLDERFNMRSQSRAWQT